MPNRFYVLIIALLISFSSRCQEVIYYPSSWNPVYTIPDQDRTALVAYAKQYLGTPSARLMQ